MKIQTHTKVDTGYTCIFFYLYFYLWIKVSCTCIFFYVKKNLYGEENGEREKKDINLMKVKTDSTREFEENNKRMGNRRMEERNQKKKLSQPKNGQCHQNSQRERAWCVNSIPGPWNSFSVSNLLSLCLLGNRRENYTSLH